MSHDSPVYECSERRGKEQYVRVDLQLWYLSGQPHLKHIQRHTYIYIHTHVNGYKQA